MRIERKNGGEELWRREQSDWNKSIKHVFSTSHRSFCFENYDKNKYSKYWRGSRSRSWGCIGSTCRSIRCIGWRAQSPRWSSHYRSISQIGQNIFLFMSLVSRIHRGCHHLILVCGGRSEGGSVMDGMRSWLPRCRSGSISNAVICRVRRSRGNVSTETKTVKPPMKRVFLQYYINLRISKWIPIFTLCLECSIVGYFSINLAIFTLPHCSRTIPQSRWART